MNVHHIVPEAEDGTNDLDNAIALCLRCHGEAGHYNFKHPIGCKYSPAELRKHRDLWWEWCKEHPTISLISGDADTPVPELAIKLFRLERDQRHKDTIIFAQRMHSSPHFRFGFALENTGIIIAKEIYIKTNFYWRGDYPSAALQVQTPPDAKGWITDVDQLVNEQWAILIFDGGAEFKCLPDHPVRWKDFSISLKEHVNGYFDIHYVVSSTQPYTRKTDRLRIDMR